MSTSLLYIYWGTIKAYPEKSGVAKLTVPEGEGWATEGKHNATMP